MTVHRTVEDALDLGISELKRAGALRYVQGNLKWPRAVAIAASVAFRVQDGPLGTPELILTYHVKKGSDPPQFLKLTFPLVATRPNYGGRRWWFRCSCGRRCANLYVPYGETEFACRLCHELAYPSQRQKKSDRLLNRARNLERRLTIRADGSLARPRGMHRRTYERILEEIDDLETEAIVRDFGPLLWGRDVTDALLATAKPQ